MLSAPGRYIRDHWRGLHGLAWSFWVNLVALRGAIMLVQDWLSPGEFQSYQHLIWIILPAALFFHGAVFIWQAVGVLRAAENWYRETGSQAHVWGAQLCLVAACWLTLTYALGAWQMTLPPARDGDILEVLDAEHRSKYRLETISGDNSILINGTIELGITKNVSGFLQKHPQTRRAVLESSGGNIFEARGLARVFREAGLDTHASGICASACTTAFIGGKQRTISQGARLGFHQYRVDANYSVRSDTAEQQRKDREIYLEAGVAPAFVDRMFDASPDDMWFPDAGELLQAGVIHAVTAQ